MKRKIIEIDETKCNGCGQCILDCAEGALEIVDGKAQVISDNLCDGLGACLGGCPQGALEIIEKDTDAFDEVAVHRLKQKTRLASPVCPGTLFASLPAHGGSGGHWPLKVRLVPSTAPFLRAAKVIVTADCAAAVMPEFHNMTEGQRVLLACPKFEPQQELKAKLKEIIEQASLSGMNILRMEVPCCAALGRICREAALEAGIEVRAEEMIVRCDGTVAESDRPGQATTHG